MIQHILLFKFTNDIPDSVISDIIDKFNDCKAQLNGFISLQHGKNISTKKHLSGNFNYCVIMSFNDLDSLNEYNTLKEHKEAQELQKPFLDEVLVFDINV